MLLYFISLLDEESLFVTLDG
uniref:Uncharacterized protein n=1 Tax=Rhizophora mucronata TaxID=61149 RepID=A0A2P2NWM0_RHIMU